MLCCPMFSYQNRVQWVVGGCRQFNMAGRLRNGRKSSCICMCDENAIHLSFSGCSSSCLFPRVSSPFIPQTKWSWSIHAMCLCQVKRALHSQECVMVERQNNNIVLYQNYLSVFHVITHNHPQIQPMLFFLKENVASKSPSTLRKPRYSVL